MATLQQQLRALRRPRERRSPPTPLQKLGVAWAGDDFCSKLSRLLRNRGASLHIATVGKRGWVWAVVDGVRHDLITCNDGDRSVTSLFQRSAIGRNIAELIAAEGVVVGVRWEAERLYFWVTHPATNAVASWTIIAVLHGHQAEYPLEDA